MIGMFCQVKEYHGDQKLYDVFDATAKAVIEERITLVPDLLSVDQLALRKQELETVEVLFSTWGAPPFTREQLQEYFPALKAFFYGAGSVQYFARPYLEEGVQVFCAAAANAVPVAEFTLAQILLANKGYFQTTKRYTGGDHTCARKLYEQMPGNYDQRVGLIGCGAIARLLIGLLSDFRLDVVVYDPYLPDPAAGELGVTKVSLEELFRTSQVVSNHLPNNEETKGMLTYDLFSKMMPYATFINTGRGAQVVEGDLIRALTEIPTRTALLDVTDPEPANKGHAFYTMDNVFLSPHIAGSSGYELRRMGLLMAKEAVRWLDKKPLSHEVTLDMLTTMA